VLPLEPADILRLLFAKATALSKDETEVKLVFVPPELAISSCKCCTLKSCANSEVVIKKVSAIKAYRCEVKVKVFICGLSLLFNEFGISDNNI
jgi:hypothetical protein